MQHPTRGKTVKPAIVMATGTSWLQGMAALTTTQQTFFGQKKRERTCERTCKNTILNSQKNVPSPAITVITYDDTEHSRRSNRHFHTCIQSHQKESSRERRACNRIHSCSNKRPPCPTRPRHLGGDKWNNWCSTGHSRGWFPLR